MFFFIFFSIFNIVKKAPEKGTFLWIGQYHFKIYDRKTVKKISIRLKEGFGELGNVSAFFLVWNIKRY